LTAALKRLWKNEYVQTVTTISLIVIIFFGFWYGSTVALNTQNPVVVVPSGSMCIPYDGACQDYLWSHPFDRTLHVGDLLILQGVNTRELNTDYPNSDIIVFISPRDPTELIVHRIVSAQEIDGVLYFKTKGDGNGINKWPATPQSLSDYDNWPEPGVSEKAVVGKVIMRIPWIGNIVLYMRTPSGLAIVAVLIALLLIIEFVIPVLRKRQTTTSVEPQKDGPTSATGVFINKTPAYKVI
jgi:signal peptidase I